MKTYILTVFDKDGTKLYEESTTMDSETKAISWGEEKLKEENYANHTSRLTSSAGKLVLFHR